MIIFYFFAAVLIFFSFRSLRGGINYLEFFQKEIAKTPPDFAPFCTIIAPCRGVDADLPENLAALFRQNYPRYEIIFVADDERDAAVKIIEEISRRETNPAKLIIASKTVESSQKVENLREAVLHADADSEVFVFVDSDARPAENWLRCLVAPLSRDETGAATGYRWFISKKRNFASELRSVWNASIASALGENSESNFCWGGSTAIRRATFERLNVRECWGGTISDDFTLTRLIKENNLKIAFAPQCLTASIDDCTFGEMLEFTTRQMKITRVYAARLWLLSLVGALLFNAVMIWAGFILVFAPPTSVAFWAAAFTLFSVTVFSIGKSSLRLRAVGLVLTDYREDLNKQFWTQNILWLISSALFLYNCLRAFFSRRIVWRGIEYQMKSARKTIVRRKNAADFDEKI